MKLSSLSASPYIQTVVEKIGWNRMSKQEQLMVAGLIAFIFAILLFQFLFSPLLD